MMKSVKILFVGLFCTLLLTGFANQNAFAEKISARGSDSTIKLVKALAAAYQEKTGNALQIEGGGSSKGAKDCLAGKVDLAFMSRGPKDKETSAGLVVVPYAIDGVAIIVHKANPTSDLTLAQLKSIYTGEMKKWSDGKPVMAFNRPPTSGTREVFQKKVLGKNTQFDKRIKIKHNRAALVTVSRAVTAVAYTSVGSLTGDEALKVVTVEGTLPKAETLRSGAYPIARTLHFATNGTVKPQVKAFLDFVLSPEGKVIIEKTGFVSL